MATVPLRRGRAAHCQLGCRHEQCPPAHQTGRRRRVGGAAWAAGSCARSRPAADGPLSRTGGCGVDGATRRRRFSTDPRHDDLRRLTNEGAGTIPAVDAASRSGSLQPVRGAGSSDRGNRLGVRRAWAARCRDLAPLVGGSVRRGEASADDLSELERRVLLSYEEALTAAGGDARGVRRAYRLALGLRWHVVLGTAQAWLDPTITKMRGSRPGESRAEGLHHLVALSKHLLESAGEGVG